MLRATRRERDRSTHVGNAHTAATIPPAPPSDSTRRSAGRGPRTWPRTITSNTAAAASAQAAKPTPSADTPAAVTSAKGIAPRGPAPSQRSCTTTSPPSARIMGSVVISLIEPDEVVGALHVKGGVRERQVGRERRATDDEHGSERYRIRQDARCRLPRPCAPATRERFELARAERKARRRERR